MLFCQYPASIPRASLGLLGTGQAHLSMPHCPASKLLAVLARHKVPERRRDAEYLRHPKDALSLHVSPHRARVAPKVAKAASKAGKVTALQRQKRAWSRVADTAQIKGTSWSHNSVKSKQQLPGKSGMAVK